NGIIHVIDKVLTPSDTPRDIPRTAQCTGAHDSLVAAVIQAELLTTLQGEGPFTVFAPTDQAFTDAGIDLTALDTPEGKQTLSDILLYHVIASEVPSSAVTDCLSADTVNTNPLSFTVDNSGVMVNSATVVTPDVQTSNGVIHVIDKVLLPTATPNDIPRTAQCTGNHSTLVGAVIQAELLATLQGEGPFTVFAPTDKAFIDAGINLAALNTEEGKAQLTDILLHHVYISEAVLSSQITDGATLSMANGDNITISVTDGSVMIGDATVTLADVATSNGVIHVVDKVIMPPSDVVDDSSDDSSSDSEDGIFGLSDGQATIVGAIGVVAILALIGGTVLFIRSKGAAATLAKDFASGGLMNQLQTVDESAYTATSAQVTTQAAVEVQPVQTVEVIEQQPAVAEPQVLRQWTDDSGYTWRAMDDGTTYWWTGSDWKKYG
ncbi:MAG: fasciclin domain-containing protein, partial [Candidatus Thermoplasmatota archaeon]|nr:fasciclin domain-containing protein [Candidatus Thermoplasmatota archaeon]